MGRMGAEDPMGIPGSTPWPRRQHDLVATGTLAAKFNARGAKEVRRNLG
jgi:hypothetical protein